MTGNSWAFHDLLHSPDVTSHHFVCKLRLLLNADWPSVLIATAVTTSVSPSSVFCTAPRVKSTILTDSPHGQRREEVLGQRAGRPPVKKTSILFEVL